MSWIETARITIKEIKERHEETLVVQEAEELAQALARDGEGATKLVTVDVSGAC